MPGHAAPKKSKRFFLSVPLDPQRLQDAYERERKLRVEYETTIQGLVEEIEKSKEQQKETRKDHDRHMELTIRTFQEHVDGHATNAAELHKTLTLVESEIQGHVETRKKQQDEIEELRAELAIAKSKVPSSMLFSAVGGYTPKRPMSDCENTGSTIAEQIKCLLSIRDKMRMEVNWKASEPVVPPKNWTGIVTDGKRGVRKLDFSGFGLNCDLSTLSPVLGARLSELKLYENPKVRGSVSLLQDCTSLRCIALQHCEMIEGNLSAFMRCTKLITLDLRFTAITGNLTALEACTALRYVDLRETHITGAISIFEKCPALQVALLGYSDVFGDLRVFEHTQSLVHLDLVRCARITGNLESLSHCSALQRLHIGYTAATRDSGGEWIVSGDIASLSSCNGLVEVHLENTATYGDVKSLDSCQTLRILKYG